MQVGTQNFVGLNLGVSCKCTPPKGEIVHRPSPPEARMHPPGEPGLTFFIIGRRRVRLFNLGSILYSNNDDD